MNNQTPTDGGQANSGKAGAAAANSNASGARIEGGGTHEEGPAAKLAEGEREFRSYALPILRNLAMGEAAVCFAIVLFASRTEYHSLPSKISIIAACVAIPACIALTAAHGVAAYFGPAGFRFFDSGICRLLSHVLSLVGAIATLLSFGGLLGFIHPVAAIAFGVATVISLVLWAIMYSAIVLEMTEKGESIVLETSQKATSASASTKNPPAR